MILYRLIKNGEENKIPVNTDEDGYAWVEVFYPVLERAEIALKRFHQAGATNLRIQEVKFEL